ncbi:MAG TPA: hypothetical protein VGN17_00425 [Bryobacteraceae bacterium]|jgi:hypothetical protein
MAITVNHTVTRTYKNQGSTARTLTETVSGNTERNLAVTVSASTNNHEVDLAFLHADLKSLSITSDQAVTIYTNAASSMSPQDTIPIAAGQVLIWTLATDLIARCPFSDNVTALFITNTGGTAANIYIDSILTI